MLKSWKTSLLGLFALFAAAINPLTALWDGDATTNPDWSFVFMGLFTFLIGLFAKDAVETAIPLPTKKA